MDSTKEIMDFIKECERAMGCDAPKRTCHFCDETRVKEGVLPFTWNGDPIEAHYDCVPCAICSRRKRNLGVTQRADGTHVHVDCAEGRDMDEMEKLDSEIARLTKRLTKDGYSDEIVNALAEATMQRFGKSIFQ